MSTNVLVANNLKRLVDMSVDSPGPFISNASIWFPGRATSFSNNNLLARALASLKNRVLFITSSKTDLRLIVYGITEYGSTTYYETIHDFFPIGSQNMNISLSDKYRYIAFNLVADAVGTSFLVLYVTGKQR